MSEAAQIVDRILESSFDPDAILRDMGGMFDRENQLRELAKAENLSFNFGFYIGTGESSMIEQNMQDDGVDTSTPDFWDKLTDSFMQLERNLTSVIQQNGLVLRPEGHGDGGDLVGTAWLYIHDNDRLNETGIDLMRGMVDSDEPLRSSSGSITALKGFEKVYEGVDERIEKAAELSFGVFGVERLKRFYEYLDDGVPMEDILAKVGIGESFLAPPEPSGIFRKIVQGCEIYSARCPGCKRIHGNFRTYDQAAGNRQCKYCNRDYVEKMTKVTTTGNFKHILKSKHEIKAARV